MGRPVAFNTAEQLLMTLEFWRKYQIFAYLSDDWSVYASTVHCLVERAKIALVIGR